MGRTVLKSPVAMAARAARVTLVAGAVLVPLAWLAPAGFGLDVPGGRANPTTTQPAEAATTKPTTSPSADAGTSDHSSESKPETKPEKKPEKQPEKGPEARQPGPNGHIVQKGDLSLEVKGDGLFAPAEAYELRPIFKAYAGAMQITAIAQPGQKVKKGDTLLECDTAGITWALTGAESDLTVAKAALQKAASDIALGTIADQMNLKQAEDAVKNAEAGKKWFDDLDGPHMLKSADLQVKSAQNAVDDQNDELDQLRKMYKDEELTSATADIVVKRAVRGLENSKISQKMIQERRDKVKQFDYPITRQRVLDALDGAKHGLTLLKASQAQTTVTRQASLTAAKVGFEQANKRLNDLREDQQLFSIKATVDGVVAYGTLVEGQWVGGDPRALKPGERIGSGQSVLRVYTPGKLRVTLNVPEQQAMWVEQGMKARVAPAAMPQRSCVGTCQSVEVLPRGNPATVGFVVTIELGDLDPRLLPGMKASVQIDAGKAEGAVLVPVAAVSDGKVQVRRKDGHVTEKAVEIGKCDGNQVEIRHGLKAGDEVVLPGKK